MEKPKWQQLASHVVVDTPHFRLRRDVVQLPNGVIIDDYHVRTSLGFCMIFALDSDDRVILVREYRYGNDSFFLELPAGARDEGESPLACAQRELSEETGYEAAHWERIGSFSGEPVRSNSVCHVYVARDARRVRAQRLDPGEFMVVECVALPEFRAMLLDGRIESGHVIAGAHLALAHIEHTASPLAD